ncbi:hypothetical protein C8R43DRAFT_1242488 [Mycena crocata]|nr:hypothetical protein C8R43DRAFT_1242488 [Mycena crocata]
MAELIRMTENRNPRSRSQAQQEDRSVQRIADHIATVKRLLKKEAERDSKNRKLNPDARLDFDNLTPAVTAGVGLSGISEDDFRRRRSDEHSQQSGRSFQSYTQGWNEPTHSRAGPSQQTARVSESRSDGSRESSETFHRAMAGIRTHLANHSDPATSPWRGINIAGYIEATSATLVLRLMDRWLRGQDMSFDVLIWNAVVFAAQGPELAQEWRRSLRSDKRRLGIG